MKRIFAACFLTLFIVLAAGCSQTASEEDTFEKQHYDAQAGQVTSIALDVRDRAVNVVATDNDAVSLDYWESTKEAYDVSVSDSGELTVAMRENKEWTDYVGLKTPVEQRTITISVPEECLDSVEISTTNSDLEMSQTCAGTIRLQNNGGDIHFTDLRSDQAIELNGKNGNITGTISGEPADYAVSCEIKKGKCNLEDRDGGNRSLNITENNGDVEIDFVPAADER